MNKIRDKFYHAPTNENLHKELFMITYIDNEIITIKNDKKQFNLGLENNSFNDKSIKEINILHRREELGFAKQNKLLPGQWINIHFNDDIPVIITGEIISLDEDILAKILFTLISNTKE